MKVLFLLPKQKTTNAFRIEECESYISEDDEKVF